jgi:hypothetical protein
VNSAKTKHSNIVWGYYCCHMTHTTHIAVNWRACSQGSSWWLLPFLYRFTVVSISPTRNKSPAAELHAGARHTYEGVLPGAPKGAFTTLLSPPQCHAAFCTMSHTLASVDKSPVCRPRTLPLSAMRTPRVGFWREWLLVSQDRSCCVKVVRLLVS